MRIMCVCNETHEFIQNENALREEQITMGK
jgi:hypothetical protein